MAAGGQRLIDAISGLTEVVGSTVKTLNLAKGGNAGILTNLTSSKEGVLYGEWINNTPYVSGNLIFILLDYPKFFDYLDNKDEMKSWLKNITELHSDTIEGYTKTLTVNYGETAIGGTSETVQAALNTLIAKSEPVMTFTEKLGKPFEKFWNFFIRYGIKDPYTKQALISTLESYDGDAWTLDKSSFSGIAIELDPTGTQVVEAYLSVNMQPTTAGDITNKKDKTADGEYRVLSIPFTAITISTESVRQLAQSLIDVISANYYDPESSQMVYNAVVSDLETDGTIADTVGSI